MKNVAIVNSCDWGSTGKIALGLLKNFKIKGYNAYFYCGRGRGSSDSHVIYFESKIETAIHAILGKLTGLSGNFSYFATKRMMNDFCRKDIDTVYLLSPHGYYLNENVFFDYVNKLNIHLVYIMIDEYPYLGKCTNAPSCTTYKLGYGKCSNIKKYPPSLCFDTCRYILKRKKNNYNKVPTALFVGPQFVIDSSKESFVGKNLKMVSLDEAIDTQLYQPRETTSLKKDLGIKENQRIIVCVANTRAASKGGKYFTELAKQFAEDDRFVFIHIGYKESPYGLPSNYIPISFIEKDEDVAKYYSMADLFVFPSVFDTMSNTCLEALACGTPLLTFDISGMPYLMDDTVGSMIPPFDILRMAEIVQRVEKKTEQTIRTCRAYVLRRYDNRTYADKLISLTLADEK